MAQLYRHFDKEDGLLYVGISTYALWRLSQHAMSPWFKEIAQVTIQHFDTRREALDAERDAIVREKPKFNKALVPTDATETLGRVDGPVHPGEIIGGILEDIGVSMRSAAAAMGVSHNALANVVRGDAGITPDMSVRLRAYMNNGPEGDEFWLRLQMDYDLWHARKRLKAEAAKIKPAPREPKAA